MKSFKGFNKDMTCRGFQYEEGKSYETEKADVCKKGFHACEYPLDCFSYYNPAESVFHEVEQDGELSKNEDKTASTKIKIGVRLSIADLVKAAIDFTMSKVKPEASADEEHGASSATGNCGASSATGNCGASSATGDYGASSATGYKGASSATGNCGASSATGNCGASSATGYKGASSATGNCGASSSATGDYGASSATGDYGASSATGDYGASSATGYKGASSATGNCGASSATGNCGASSATGNCGASSATGDYGASSATGNCGVASVTGYNSSAEVKNPTALAVAWGYKSHAKGVKGSYLVLADWEGDEDYPNDPEKWTLKGVKLVHIDGKKYKENTWYEYSDGAVREWTEE